MANLSQNGKYECTLNFYVEWVEGATHLMTGAERAVCPKLGVPCRDSLKRRTCEQKRASAIISVEPAICVTITCTYIKTGSTKTQHTH